MEDFQSFYVHHCILFIKHLVTENVRKNITKEHNNVSKILLWHFLAILTLIGVRCQIQYVLGCLQINISFLCLIL